MTRKKEEIYMLTLNGLLHNNPEVFDKIVTYMFKTKTNAIVFEDNTGGEFTKVEKQK